MATTQHYGRDTQTDTFWARCPRCGAETTGHKASATPYRFLYSMTCAEQADFLAELAAARQEVPRA